METKTYYRATLARVVEVAAGMDEVADEMNATQQLVGHYTFEPDSNQFAKSINLGLGLVLRHMHSTISARRSRHDGILG